MQRAAASPKNADASSAAPKNSENSKLLMTTGKEHGKLYHLLNM
jgi:hypothetical protein